MMAGGPAKRFVSFLDTCGKKSGEEILIDKMQPRACINAPI